MSRQTFPSLATRLRFRHLSWVVFAIVLAIVTFYVVRSLTIGGIARAQGNVTPFTLKIDDYDFDGNPQGLLYHKEIVMRRSDGTTVTIGNPFGLVGFKAGDTIRTFRLLDGEGFQVYDSIAAFTKWPTISGLALATLKERMFTAPANCVFSRETFVGYDTVLGHKVAMVNWPMIGTAQDTDWRALDLMCEGLQHRTQIKQADGSFKLKAEGKAVSLEIGEPDPSMFEVPPSYTSLKPSEAGRREADRLGVPWTQDMDIAAGIEDARASGQPPSSVKRN